MDPAFSLADELAELHTLPHNEFDDQQHFVHHHGSGLEDEFDQLHLHQQAISSLGDELDTLHHHQGSSLHHGEDLAAELGEFEVDGMSREADSAAYCGGGDGRAAVSLLGSEQIGGSMAATDHFVSLLSASTNEGDTVRLEEQAGRYLKLLSECTVQREGQVRELRELERRSRTLVQHSQWASSEETPHSHSHNHTLSDASTITTETHQPAMGFSQLTHSTTTLLASLTSLHEATQVTKSTTADAGRKLKQLKTLISTYHAERDSVQASEVWISHQPPPTTTTNARDQVSHHVDYITQKLLEAESNAKTLLTPLSIA